MSMQVNLKPEQEHFVQQQLATGKYQNVEEVIAAALELLQNFTLATNTKKLEALRQKIAIGTEQIAQGQVTHGEVVFDRLHEKICREYES